MQDFSQILAKFNFNTKHFVSSLVSINCKCRLWVHSERFIAWSCLSFLLQQMDIIGNTYCIKTIGTNEYLDIALSSIDRFIQPCQSYCSLSFNNTSKWLIKADCVFFIIASLSKVLSNSVESLYLLSSLVLHQLWVKSF